MSIKQYNRGYYTGVFDIIHNGHIRAISNAADLCDQLVVGVSTDEVVYSYKNKYPILPFESRVEVVNNIKGVAAAIPQTDLHNKVDVCLALGCDVIFSSEEYREDYYEGREMTLKEQAGVERWKAIQDEANQNGIDVVYLPRSQGVSSTFIKESVVDQMGYQPSQNIMLYSEGESCDETVFSL